MRQYDICELICHVIAVVDFRLRWSNFLLEHLWVMHKKQSVNAQ